MTGLDFAISIGDPDDLADINPGFVEPSVRLPRSDGPRGLVLKGFIFEDSYGGFSFFRRHQQVFFMAVSFDLSGTPPVILPPKEIDVHQYVRKVSRDEPVVRFDFGEGAPVAPPRDIAGGLVVYLLLLDSDEGARHAGEVISGVHGELDKDDSLVDVVKNWLKNPGYEVGKFIAEAGAAALAPMARILEGNRDDSLAAFQGFFRADEEWSGLTPSQNGVTAYLAEV